MKIKYLNMKKETFDEVVCAVVLFGVEDVTAMDEEGNIVATINILYLWSIEQ